MRKAVAEADLGERWGVVFFDLLNFQMPIGCPDRDGCGSPQLGADSLLLTEVWEMR